MKKLLAITMIATALALPVSAAGKLVHVVAFKFKPEVTAAQKQEVQDAFAALKAKIPQIISLEHGTNVSKEGFDKGFTHAFVVKFANEADRDAYLVHPDHKKFGALLGGKLAEGGVFVVDFLTKE